jgi:hypothetical protein
LPPRSKMMAARICEEISRRRSRAAAASMGSR